MYMNATQLEILEKVSDQGFLYVIHTFHETKR